MLPPFRGKKRLARRLYAGLIRSCTPMETVGKFGCTYFLPNISENVAFDIFVNGIYELPTHRFLKSRVPQHATILDLGANIGSVSIPLLKVRTDLRCFAVEAVPWINEYLVRNIDVNGLVNRIVPINLALSDKDDAQLPFYVTEKYFGKGSLWPSWTKEHIMVSTITVDTLLQRNYIGKVDFVKIDVEGFEYYAFLGGRSLFSGEEAPDILLEFMDWAEKGAGLRPGQAQELLMQYGYDLYLLTVNGVLRKLNGPLSSGAAMIFATKRSPVI